MTTGPRALLRKVLALNDSPHAIALGVGVGIFVGLTPTVGVQTILILGVVFATRKFVYFNATAAMASTYVSNPITMLPMYYGWYRIGAWFCSGSLTATEFEQLMQFEGLAGWWSAMCALGAQVAFPMCLGALLTAPIGVAVAYPLTYFLVKWVRENKPSKQSKQEASILPSPSEDAISSELRIDAHDPAATSADRAVTKPKATKQKSLLSS
ncbi:MAG: DUF2062 domain-containing protein [Fuerstiella sp.]